MAKRRVDLFAAGATILTVVMFGVYLGVIADQGGDVALWYVGLLVVGAVASGYGALTSAPYRRPVLLGAVLTLGVAGLLALLSIGLPLVVAAGLCGVAWVRSAGGQGQPPG